MTQPAQTIEAVAAQADGRKPLLLVFLGELDGRRPSSLRLPAYSSPERAVAALHAMYEYRLWRDRPEYVVTRFPVNRRRVERIITRHLRERRTRVGEVDAKEILRAYDLSVPEGAMAGSAQEAVEIAERIGFPVVMKVVSVDVLHKSDVGGVKLNIAGAEDVRDTFDLLTLRVGRRAPNARLDGVYVEKMCGHGILRDRRPCGFRPWSIQGVRRPDDNRLGIDKAGRRRRWATCARRNDVADRAAPERRCGNRGNVF